MKGASKADNSFFYMVKGVACILVIFIHCIFPGILGKDIQALSRFSVLYFFVISGRYLLSGIPSDASPSIIRKRMALKIRHMLAVTLGLTALYNIYSIIVAVIYGYGVKDLVTQKYNLHELWLLLMFNSGKIIYDYTYDIDHLWYLYAVLYVFVLIYIFAGVAKKWSGFLTFFFTGMLFFAELLQLYYPIRPFDISIRTWYVVRNWLFEGIPFIMGGVWLDTAVNDNRDSKASNMVRRIVDSCSTGANAHRNRLLLYVLIALGAAMSILEYRRFGEMTVYLGSVVIICAIMLLGEAYGKPGSNFKAISPLCHLGKDLSASVYYYHIMIISIISRSLYVFEENTIYMWFKPVIAAVASVLVSEMIFRIKFCMKRGMESKA